MTTTTDEYPLTARQAEVLEFIRANSGMYGPTIRQIAAAIGVNNVTGVVGHLRALEKKGYIRRTPNVARGIEVIRAD
jgi:repressor LexA